MTDAPISARLGLHINQDVTAKGLKGVVQGFLIEDGQPTRVIVSHSPKVMPPESVPVGSFWKLVDYDPADVKPV